MFQPYLIPPFIVLLLSALFISVELSVPLDTLYEGNFFFFKTDTNGILIRKKMLNLLLFSNIYIPVACFVTYQAKFCDHSRCVLVLQNIPVWFW